MRITTDSPGAEKIIVFLNNKPVTHYISAEEGENGWIEVIDSQEMPSLDLAKDDTFSWEQDETEDLKEFQVPTKKIYGLVEFRNLGNK